MTRILLVEDDPSTLLALSDKLGFEGFDVTTDRDGGQAWNRLRTTEPPFDVILLDVMLPTLDGLEVCRRLRESGDPTPVLMLTARGLESDRVHGLEIGADDYITKPFSVRELIARINAMLRRRQLDRTESGRVISAADDRVTLGPVTIDYDAFKLTRDGAEHTLSPTERDMLRLLVAQRGKVVSRDRFLTDIWGLEGNVTTRTIDFHIRRLRLKIEPVPESPTWITTVHGVGYRLEVPE